MNTVRWLAIACSITVALVGQPATASATPGIGVEALTISQATVDGYDYTTKEITINPGGSTGWHYHGGRVFGVIREGTLTRTMADCSVNGVFPAGSPVTEGSGPESVHNGRNLGLAPLVMWVVYIDPAGSQLSVDVPDPGCGFA